MNQMSKFNFGNFILGIFFIFVSILAFKNPVGDLLSIILFFGIAAIVKGGFELFARRKMSDIEEIAPKYIIIVGIIDILIGCILLFNIGASLVALPFVFAIWFIADSVVVLANAKSSKSNNALYWFTIVLGILGIVMGFLLLFNPITSALTLAFLVGIYFLIAGINYIVTAFNF